MSRAIPFAAGFLVLCLATPLSAQEDAKPHVAQAPQSLAAPAAKASDVASPDAILAAVYDVISGPAGQKRDWDRFRSLFTPGARLIPAGPDKQGHIAVHAFSPEDYIRLSDPYFQKNGFAEREIARKTGRYGHILEAFSTYESRHDAKDAAPFARGINSFQLFYDGSRWWIVTIYWEEETPDNPLPKKFLPPGR
ncbi:MAG: hypothetical protein ACRD4S_02505 [Candidatus Acidiferrales bacterium]